MQPLGKVGYSRNQDPELMSLMIADAKRTFVFGF